MPFIGVSAVMLSLYAKRKRYCIAGIRGSCAVCSLLNDACSLALELALHKLEWLWRRTKVDNYWYFFIASNKLSLLLTVQRWMQCSLDKSGIVYRVMRFFAGVGVVWRREGFMQSLNPSLPVWLWTPMMLRLYAMRLLATSFLIIQWKALWIWLFDGIIFNHESLIWIMTALSKGFQWNLSLLVTDGKIIWAPNMVK